jgi:hypothetical protein
VEGVLGPGAYAAAVEGAAPGAGKEGGAGNAKQ